MLDAGLDFTQNSTFSKLVPGLYLGWLLTVQAEVQLTSFKRLAVREEPAVVARLNVVQGRVAAQQVREKELQERHKELQALAADLGISTARPGFST